jgi:hypothetical protein
MCVVKDKIRLAGVLAALGLFICTAAYGQRASTRGPVKTEATAPCTLETKDARQIRGIRLGMPVSEFLEKFPSAKEAAHSRHKVGAIIYEFDQSENPDFADGGVEMRFVWFVDGALSSVGFYYPKYEPTSVDDFVRQASARLGLPSAGWKKAFENRELVCRGFSALVGREMFRAGVGDPFIILADTAADAKVDAREKEIKRKEDEERRRRERERHVFKP